MKRYVLFILLIFIVFQANAQESSIPSSFIDLPIGARQLVFGNSFVAMSDDINVIYSNPATLVDVYQLGFTATHIMLYEYEGLIYDSVGFLYSKMPFWLPKGILYKRLGLNTLIESDEYGTITSTEGNYSENTISLLFSNKLPLNFALGIAPKFYYTGYQLDTRGFGVDIGLYNSDLFRIKTSRVTMGILIHNAYSTINYGDNMPETFLKNIDVAIGYKSLRYNIAAGYSTNTGAINVAGECFLGDMFDVRLGYGNRNNENILRAGFGFRKNILIDYGFELHPWLGITHRITVSYSLELRGKLIIPELKKGYKIYINKKYYKKCKNNNKEEIYLLPRKYKIEIYDKEGILDRREEFELTSKQTKIISKDIGKKLYKQGREALDKGDYKTAKIKIGQSIKKSKNIPERWYYLGRTYVHIRNKEKAIFSFREAMKLNKEEYGYLKEIIEDINIAEETPKYQKEREKIKQENKETKEKVEKKAKSKKVIKEYPIQKNKTKEKETTKLPKKQVVRFELGSNEISKKYENILNEYIAVMSKSKECKLKIIGYTDSIGTAASNKILSEERAKKISEWFIQKGISPKRIKHEGRGESKPIASNDTEKGRAKNRRVEVILIK